ncbi:MAG TPA: SDR family NAD(P)-dependent oxidoreductase [Ignavibacteria bacterium]|nr:SDR family NAD(P)-dependent oxidoreductase [Ignavibacteria bacterium]HMQ99871.1 SDR family NAD(P)-dependent oxidoreductase [Ignavibacteria bacterium]
MSKFKKIVIFGASQGIGKALALEYARTGSSLVLLSRNEKETGAIALEISTESCKCYSKKCDVTLLDDVREGLAFAANSLGSIDLVIINSGVGGPNWMQSFSSEQFKQTFAVNTFGIAHVLECVIPIMKKQGYGTIAGITSLADVRGYGGSSSYSASKAAGSILLEAARVELKKDNIRVITVRPGFVKTAMTDKNEFKMPLLMQPDKAARIIRKGIESGRSIVQFPFPIVMATRLIKFLPNRIFDWAMNLARPKK